MASNESENFYRMVSVIVNVGTPVLRKLLLKYVHQSLGGASTSGMAPVDYFLLSNQHILSQLRQQRVLRQDQVNLLIPSGGRPTDLDTWDISLTAVILKNMCPMSQGDLADVETLRVLRNTVYGHKPSAAMPYTAFITTWQSIDGVLTSLLKACNDKSFEQTTTDLIQKIRDDALEIGSTVEMLKKWYADDREVDSKLGDIDEKIGTLIDEVSAMKKPSDTKTANPMFMKIKKHTAAMLNKASSSSFIFTGQFGIADRTLDANNVVIITGGPCDGKSMTAKQLIMKNNTIDRCVILGNCSQWEDIDTAETEAILIDDMFGDCSFDEKVFKDWIPALDIIQSCVHSGQIKVVIVIGRIVYEQGKLHLSKYDMFNYKVDVGTRLVAIDERIEIFNSFLSIYGKTVTSKTMEDLSQKFTFPFGFAECCRLFVTSTVYFDIGESFFDIPFAVFNKVIDAMPKSHYLALLFVFYKRGSVPESELKPSRHSQNTAASLLSDVANMIGVNAQTVTLHSIRQLLTAMTGIFIKNEHKTFAFYDASVEHCLLLHFGASFPEEVVENCSVDFLKTRIDIQPNVQPDKLSIDEDSFDILADRFIRLLKDDENKKEFAKHSILKKHVFIEVILNKVVEAGIADEFLNGKDETIGNGFVRCFLTENEDELCAPFIETLLKFTKDNDCTKHELGAMDTADKIADNAIMSSAVCWRRTVISHSLNEVCLKGFLRCFRVFTSVGISMHPDTLLAAVRGGNTDIVRQIIDVLKKNSTEFRTTLAEAISEAEKIGNADTLSILNSENDIDTANVQDYDTKTAKDGGTNTAKDHGTSKANDNDTNTAKDDGTSRANDNDTNTAKDDDTYSANDDDTNTVKGDDTKPEKDDNTKPANEDDTKNAKNADTKNAMDDDT